MKNRVVYIPPVLPEDKHAPHFNSHVSMIGLSWQWSRVMVVVEELACGSLWWMSFLWEWIQGRAWVRPQQLPLFEWMVATQTSWNLGLGWLTSAESGLNWWARIFWWQHLIMSTVKKMIPLTQQLYWSEGSVQPSSAYCCQQCLNYKLSLKLYITDIPVGYFGVTDITPHTHTCAAGVGYVFSSGEVYNCTIKKYTHDIMIWLLLIYSSTIISQCCGDSLSYRPAHNSGHSLLKLTLHSACATIKHTIIVHCWP